MLVVLVLRLVVLMLLLSNEDSLGGCGVDNAADVARGIVGGALCFEPFLHSSFIITSTKQTLQVPLMSCDILQHGAMPTQHLCCRYYLRQE